jgi:hypothetical protein
MRRITQLTVFVGNQMDESLEPVFSNWNQKRRTRHNWPIQDGPETLPAGSKAVYRIAAPNDEAVLHTGLPAQLTVYDRGQEQWATHTFTPGER